MLAFTNDMFPRVAFATSEDHRWTLSSWQAQRPREGILSLKGKLYFLTTRLQFFVVDPPQHVGKKGSPSSSSLPTPRMVAICTLDKIRPPLFLAECDSEVLLVGRTDKSRRHIIIYKLADIIQGMFIPLESTGDNSLFTWKRSICVSSKAHPTIAGSSVVCLHPSFKYLGQYHLRSQSWSTATDGHFLRGPIPCPYTLIHHIYTCYDRHYW